MRKILVANRGEIAIRIMNTAHKMGIKTVAIYSEADANALHVMTANEAFYVGKAPSNESYLRGDKILKIAKENNVDGIHPGYGFLSENAEFAKATTEAGIKFIGPSPYSISIMGSKLSAKDAVSNYDIPMVPGTSFAVKSMEEGLSEAQKIGFPVLIKASAGGGGKGMRMVEDPAEFKEQFARAKSEALSSFGDDDVFIEKYITSPRHIEIQVLLDEHENGIYLFERDCSIQRRHQKVVEEAPSLKINDDVRKQMGEDALKVAQSCKYAGAGTVEFIMDDQNNYFFLEMNTRLQVEHPVTELITGIDLVEQQIRVARGEVLAIKQEDLTINGHAFELRVYAENPRENFSPSIGTLEVYQIPSGEGVRVDHGFLEGQEIPIYYDPMIAKLIVHAPNREMALKRLKQAISDYKIEGIETTLSFGNFVANHPAFVDGSYDTKFVNNYMHEFLEKKELSGIEKVAGWIAQTHFQRELNKV